MTDPGVDLAIKNETSKIEIRIASDLAPAVDHAMIESRLAAIRQRIEADDYRSAVTSEGGTGLIKLHRIVEGRNRKGDVSFGIEDGRFVIDLQIEFRLETTL